MKDGESTFLMLGALAKHLKIDPEEFGRSLADVKGIADFLGKMTHAFGVATLEEMTKKKEEEKPE